jgi:hypothetical protein
MSATSRHPSVTYGVSPLAAAKGGIDANHHTVLSLSNRLGNFVLFSNRGTIEQGFL